MYKIFSTTQVVVFSAIYKQNCATWIGKKWWKLARYSLWKITKCIKWSQKKLAKNSSNASEKNLEIRQRMLGKKSRNSSNWCQEEITNLVKRSKKLQNSRCDQGKIIANFVWRIAEKITNLGLRIAEKSLIFCPTIAEINS